MRNDLKEQEKVHHISVIAWKALIDNKSQGEEIVHLRCTIKKLIGMGYNVISVNGKGLGYDRRKDLLYDLAKKNRSPTIQLIKTALSLISKK